MLYNNNRRNNLFSLIGTSNSISFNLNSFLITLVVLVFSFIASLVFYIKI